MNEASSWVFYRYAVGAGTLLIGIAAIMAVLYMHRISASLKRFETTIEKSSVKIQ